MMTVSGWVREIAKQVQAGADFPVRSEGLVWLLFMFLKILRRVVVST